MSRDGRWRHYGPRIALAAASLLLVAAALELGVRLARGRVLSTEHLIVERRTLTGSFYQRDARLGWSPRPGARVSGAAMGWREEAVVEGTHRDAVVTATAEGLRSNGQLSKGQLSNGQPPNGQLPGGASSPLPERPRLLAVGDSFTFGGRVSDHQTWPAELAALLGLSVLNGGVAAFGLDQIVLRAEQLAALHDPDLVIVSFIPDDLRRNALASYGADPKPFFRVVEGRLDLHDPDPPPAPGGLDPLRSLLGYSHLAVLLLGRAAPLYWSLGPAERTGESGLEIGCLLMERLVELERGESTRVTVMAQGTERSDGREAARRVLACAESLSLATVDLSPSLDRIRREEPERYRALFFGHMTPLGNRFVAETLAQDLRAAGRLH